MFTKLLQVSIKYVIIKHIQYAYTLQSHIKKGIINQSVKRGEHHASDKQEFFYLSHGHACRHAHRDVHHPMRARIFTC